MLTKIVKFLLRSLLRLLYRVEVSGLENYFKAGNRVLIIANHTSLLDGLLLYAWLPETPTFAINTQIAERRSYKPFLQFVDLFIMNPVNPLSIKAMIKFLREDHKAVIFPEGRITVTGSLMKTYEGPGLVADKADATVLPIAIDGPQFSPYSYMKGRGRIVRQLLAESVTIGALGGAAGVALAWWGTRLLLALRPPNLPRFGEVSVDLPVLGFAAATAIGTGLLFGLVPAFQASDLAAARGQLVVAPETAMPLLPSQLDDVAPGYMAALTERFAAPERAALIGVPLGDYDRGYSNSVLGLTGARAATAPYRYDKQHLVPFGEFIPTGFRWFTTLLNIPLGDFMRGVRNPPSFAFAGERIAPNICYEDLYGDELALRFADEASAPTMFANLSNIGWFGDTIAVDQHLNISRMRTLEFQRPMLRATNTGATAVIDHRARVVGHIGAPGVGLEGVPREAVSPGSRSAADASELTSPAAPGQPVRVAQLLEEIRRPVGPGEGRVPHVAGGDREEPARIDLAAVRYEEEAVPRVDASRGEPHRVARSFRAGEDRRHRDGPVVESHAFPLSHVTAVVGRFGDLDDEGRGLLRPIDHVEEALALERREPG